VKNRQVSTFLISIVIGFSSYIGDVYASNEDNIEKAGDVLSIILPISAYGFSFYFKDKPGRTQFYKSFLSNTLITVGLKYAIDKERPDGSDENSFPSGHTAYTFQAASFVQLRYGWKYATALYLAAIYTGYSRVKAEKHYVEDVLAGAAIGFSNSYYFTTPFEGFDINPVARYGYYGLSVKKSW